MGPKGQNKRRRHVWSSSPIGGRGRSVISPIALLGIAGTQFIHGSRHQVSESCFSHRRLLTGIDQSLWAPGPSNTRT